MSLAIHLDSVAFAFGASAVLSETTLSLEAGSFVVLAGSNGSGKSTLLRLCVGLLEPSAGVVRVLGGSPTDHAVRRRIGYAPQGLHPVTSVPVSVNEVVTAGLASIRRAPRSAERVSAALRSVGLEDLESECLFELSGGQQQRAILARALVADPAVLLLDEPTTGIDRSVRPRLAAELRRRADGGATVLVVSHDPDDFHEVLDRILIVIDGRIEEVTHEQFHRHFEVP